jgi:hypothetical protein
MIQEREPLVDLSEANEEAHRQYIAEFKRDVFPMYAEQGIALGEALILWSLNKLENRMEELNSSGF